MKVLIVDDEEEICRYLQRELRNEGYEVEYTTSSVGVLERLREAERDYYELLLLDLRMPETDGFTLLKEIREAQLDLDVIIITAYGDEDKAIESIRLGALDYLCKPFSIEELRTAIFRLQKKRAAEEKRALEYNILVSIIITAFGTHEKAIAALRLGVFRYLKKPISHEELITSVRTGIGLLALRRGLSARRRELEIATVPDSYAAGKAFGELIEGGIRRPSLIVLLGEPGTKKVFITADFIFEGLKNNEICVYVCVDHPVENVRRTMRTFGDIEVYEKEKKLIFVDAFLGRFGRPRGEYFIEDPYDLSLYDGLLYILRDKKIDRLIFDSINAIVSQPERVRLLKRFHGFIEENNALGLFIAIEGELSKEIETILRYSSDVTLRTYRKGKEFFIRVEQMRAIPHNNPEAKVIVGEEGIKMHRI